MPRRESDDFPPSWVVLGALGATILSLALGIYRFFLVFGMAFHETANDRFTYSTITTLCWLLNPIGMLFWAHADGGQMGGGYAAFGYIIGSLMWLILLVIIWISQGKIRNQK